MRKVFIATISLGLILLIAGLFTEFIVLNHETWATKSYGGTVTLRPLSESLTELSVSRVDAVLQVIATSNSTLTIDIIHNGKLEVRWNDEEFYRNLLLRDTGAWTVRILNNSTANSCSYRSLITVKELYVAQVKPYLWLREPLLFLSGLFLSFIIPIYLLTSHRTRLNRKTMETVVALTVLVTIIFSYPIAGLALRTNMPWVVVRGVSMEPTMVSDDLAIIMGVNPLSLLPGDIILFDKVAFDIGSEEFSTISMPIIHRVLYMERFNNRTYFSTIGDNNEKPDEWLVPDEGVLGKTVLIIPKVGLLILLLERIEVKLFLIVIIFAVFFILPSIKPKKKIAGSSQQDN